MSHLGELAAALVDDTLSPAERDQALAHVAGCAQCRDELEAQRQVKAALSATGDPQPAPDLVERLLAVPADEAAAAAPRSRRLRRRRPVPARRPSYVRMLAAAASFVAIVLGLGLLVGGEGQGQRVRPQVANFVQDHNGTTSQLPLNDPAAGLVLTSFER